MSMSNPSRAARGRRRDLLLYAALVLVIAGCGGDGCAGCGLGPLPGGSLPSDQTIEGGAQVRVTPAGINKVEGVVGDVIEDALEGQGICIPEGSQGIGIGDIEFCFNDDGSCNNGCQAGLTIDSVNLTPEPGQVRIRAQIDAQIDVPVRFDPIIGPIIGPCTLNVTAPNTVVDAIVSLGLDPATGELRVNLEDIPNLEIDPDISGCSFVGAVINFIAGLIGDTVADIVRDLLEPRLQELVATLLPDPLGIENTVDLSSFLSTISPGTRGALEARVVPGGHVSTEGGGLSLGIIAGVNADADPSTRSPELDSEAAQCVPQLAAPDLAAAPFSLGRTSRNNFQVPMTGVFLGQPADIPDSDVVVGLSESFLDLAGHHAATSGALCLGLGSQLIPQLNLGIIGILVPSLAELGSREGDDPLLLVTHPQQAIDFTVGDGTEASPSLTVHLHGFAIDFYAFLFQRYTRGFTVVLDLDLGINLEFSTDEDGNPAIMPILVGLKSENIGVTVQNAEFLKEGTEDLEEVLPSLLDIALPFLTDALPDIALPDFLGFRLDDIRLSRVSTDTDDFLAIAATLGASPALARLGQRLPGVARAAERLAAPPAHHVVARGAARLVRVTTPPPEQIRAHLRGHGGAMPQVVIDVPTRDPSGRELEWTWNLEGGMWRPFRAGGRIVLEDPAFALQGRFAVQLKARAAGDYRTLSLEPAIVSVVIDSVGPRILGERAAAADGAVLVPAVDLVSPADRVQVAFGHADDAAPTTAWSDGHMPISVAEQLAAGAGGAVRAWARDEIGNQTTELVDLGAILRSHEDSASDGGCAVGGGGGGGAASGLVLLGLAALIGAGGARRRLRAAGRAVLFVLAAGALAALPACDCGGANPPADDDGTDGDQPDDGATIPDCEVNDECAEECGGSVPICDEGECRCDDDVRWGRIGQYSEMAVGPDGTAWVSAYNSYHGDLMVAARGEGGRIPDEAWEFVDGVPDGPVLVEGSEVRGGINEPGPDVGLYTDIAVAGDGTVMVSYFDQDTVSLKFASNRGGVWSSHVVAAGVPGEGKASYEIAGQYSAITARAEDGRPGIAYFVHLNGDGGERTELRFAEASVAAPAQASDWTVSVIDGAAVPAPTSDPLPIPMGVGLFVNAARLSDGSPVVVYYDRINGDLKLARYDAAAAAFGAPEVVDGGPVDVGWYPGVAIDASDVVHLSYVSATSSDLLYVNTQDGLVEVIDDGYREVGTTDDGVPLPELHFVGDDSGVVLGPDGPIVAYQDATSHELLVARRGADGTWTHVVVAGDEDPFAGGYGFYVSAGMAPDGMVMSTWVIDQPTSEAWVEILFDAPPAD